MPHPNWLEWFGYTASVVVAISLTRSSILKLRWYNLLGATLFSAYGFSIHAYPVGLLNGFIACVDIYFLIRMYSTHDQFQIISVPPGSEYLECLFHEYRVDIARYFPNFDFREYRVDIARYFPNFDFRLDEHRINFYVLRNLVPACVFIGTPGSDGILDVELDFVIPAYRDFKPGEFLFGPNRDLFQRLGFRRLVARSHDQSHGRYLQKMGFTPTGKDGECTVFTREIGHMPIHP